MSKLINFSKMKQKTGILVFLIAMFVVSTTAMAQRPKGGGMHHDCHAIDKKGSHAHCAIPELTDAQKQQIDKLRIAHMKEMLPLRNSLREKQAALRTQETAEKADLAAINKLIDEISTIRAEMRKKQAAHRQDVRQVLTEKQRLIFDTKGKKSKAHHKGKAAGHRSGCCH